MAVVTTHSNHYKFELISGNIDFDTDVFKIILMSSAFTFDLDAHATLADTQFDDWTLSTSYTSDDIVVPTVPNGHKYKCTTPGTSHTTEPTWPTDSGVTVNDNDIVWTEDGEDNQLPTSNGYTQNDKILTNVVIAEDNTNDRGRITWDNAQWDASGGDINPTGSALLYDDTNATDTIIGCIDFGTDYVISNGSSLQIQNIAINVT